MNNLELWDNLYLKLLNNEFNQVIDIIEANKNIFIEYTFYNDVSELKDVYDCIYYDLIPILSCFKKVLKYTIFDNIKDNCKILEHIILPYIKSYIDSKGINNAFLIRIKTDLRLNIQDGFNELEKRLKALIKIISIRVLKRYDINYMILYDFGNLPNEDKLKYYTEIINSILNIIKLLIKQINKFESSYTFLLYRIESIIKSKKQLIELYDFSESSDSISDIIYGPIFIPSIINIDLNSKQE